MKQNLVVRHLNDKNYVGFVFSEHLIPITKEDGTMDMKPVIGICWDNQRTPAVSYHSPEELEWLEAQPVVIEELTEYEDEEEDGVAQEREYESATDVRALNV